MPELPEVETVRLSLVDRVRGRTIADLVVNDFAGVVGPLGPEATRARAVGRTIRDVARRGKYLRFDLDDDTSLLIHLRMTGTLQLAPSDAPPLRFEHAIIRLNDGQDLRFADQRKFGRVLHVTPAEIEQLETRLGPEPLDDAFTPETLASRLGRRTGRLKSALLDQGVLAGLGNIYVDEALFRAGLHPLRVANSLNAPEILALHSAIRAALAEATANRGTTFSAFKDGDGHSGGNRANLRVYGLGRSGAPCPRCGSPLQCITVSGRSSHLCSVCQPLLPGSR